VDQQAWKDRAEWLKGELAKGGFASADDYYWTKDQYRVALAKSIGTTAAKMDPMGFWFGCQSN
jgi:hypothetical protein